MKKKEFVKGFAEKNDIARYDAIRIVDAVFAHVKDMLLEGREVRIGDVGHFSFLHRSAGVARNNILGTCREVGPRTSLKFKPFPTMKKLVKELSVDEDAL